MRQLRPRLEEVSREVWQPEVDVPAGKSNRYDIIKGMCGTQGEKLAHARRLLQCVQQPRQHNSYTCRRDHLATFRRPRRLRPSATTRDNRSMHSFGRVQESTGRSLAPSGCSKGAPRDRRFSAYLLRPWLIRGERRCGSLRYLGDTTLDPVLVTGKAAGRAIPFLR